MVWRFLRLLAAAALASAGWLVAAAPSAWAAPNGFTVDVSGGPNNGKLYSIDLATGTPSEIGPTGQNDIEGLAIHCDGTLYGVNRSSDGQPNQLVTINTSTGAATVVGPLSQEPSDAGLTFGADGRLYMAQVNVPHDFFRVDPATAVLTTIGPLGANVQLTGLAGRADGSIFGFDRTGDQLVTVNTSTGAATAVGPVSTPTLNLVGLDFDTSGTLWGIANSGAIVTFNTSTGADTQVTTYNTIQNDFVGLAIAPVGCSQPPAPPAPDIVTAPVRFTG